MGTTAALAVEHVEGSSPPTFILSRLRKLKSAAPVTISSPYEFPVEGQPNSNLMRELRWYLDKFLDYRFDPETTHAERDLGLGDVLVFCRVGGEIIEVVLIGA